MEIYKLFRNRDNPLRIAILGAGSWGTTVARILAKNVKNNYMFSNRVYLWTRRKKLVKEINSTHYNNQYLKDIKLPKNLIANDNIENIYMKSDIIFFAIPYPYIISICDNLSKLEKNNKQKIGVLLSKGIFIKNNKPYPFSYHLKELLGLETVVLSGANVAKWVAEGQFAEATIGCNNIRVGNLIKELIEVELFRINVAKDIPSVEMLGSLKNIVGMFAGIIDGLGFASNTKATIIRLGINEMINFIKYFFNKNKKNIILENCGIADTITTCYGGRNRLCAEELVKTERNIKDIEKLILNGQKLQGPTTCLQVFKILENEGLINKFPLFVTTYKIVILKKTPKETVDNYFKMI